MSGYTGKPVDIASNSRNVRNDFPALLPTYSPTSISGDTK